MKHAQTFRIDRLYHKFLKRRGGNMNQIVRLMSELERQGFIVIHWDDERLLGDRYEETEKLSSNQHKKELFKLVQGVLNENI